MNLFYELALMQDYSGLKALKILNYTVLEAGI